MRPLHLVLVIALLSLMNGTDPARNDMPGMAALVIHDGPDGGDDACGCKDGAIVFWKRRISREGSLLRL